MSLRIDISPSLHGIITIFRLTGGVFEQVSSGGEESPELPQKHHPGHHIYKVAELYLFGDSLCHYGVLLCL